MDRHECPTIFSEADWNDLSVEVRAVLVTLVDMVRHLSAQVQRLHTQVDDLQACVRQTSQNSSKPPSSDPPSAPPRPSAPSSGRARGGQKGHPGHQRPLAPPEQVDTIVPLYPAHCTHCQHALDATLADGTPPERIQVRDLPARLIHVTE